jgi:hypothetical protein
MTPLMKYLLEVSGCIAVVYLLYVVCFRNNTFFSLNRFYLLVGLLVSFVIPVVDLPEYLTRNHAQVSMITLHSIQTDYIPVSFQSSASEKPSLTFVTLLAMVYGCGVTFFLLRFLVGIRKVLELKRNSVQTEMAGVSVYLQHELPAFSFFNMIFVNHDVDRFILEHEQLHVKEKHWIDILLVQVASILLWFNPVMFFYQRAIKSQHEFLADADVITRGARVDSYLPCLLNAAYKNNGLTLASQFGSNSIKNRITMITKNKTPLLYAMLYLLVIPAFAFLLFAFQDSATATKKENSAMVSLNQNVPTDAPVNLTKVESQVGFGPRMHPATNKMVKHTGIDFVMNAGEDVMATADGIVVDAAYDDMKGNYVVIRHSDQFATQYFHLQSIAKKKGVAVKKGDVIGLVGTSGVLSMNNHLHYEVLLDGQAVDPSAYLPAAKE